VLEAGRFSFYRICVIVRGERHATEIVTLGGAAVSATSSVPIIIPATERQTDSVTSRLYACHCE
jgi:hypothetical protein